MMKSQQLNTFIAVILLLLPAAVLAQAPAPHGSSLTGIIPDSTASASFDIYPVPNEGNFSAEILSPFADAYTIQVYDQLGRKLFELGDVKTVAGKSVTRISLGPVANGFYFVVFKNDQSKVIRRITVYK